MLRELSAMCSYAPQFKHLTPRSIVVTSHELTRNHCKVCLGCEGLLGSCGCSLTSLDVFVFYMVSAMPMSDERRNLTLSCQRRIARHAALLDFPFVALPQSPRHQMP